MNTPVDEIGIKADRLREESTDHISQMQPADLVPVPADLHETVLLRTPTAEHITHGVDC